MIIRPGNQIMGADLTMTCAAGMSSLEGQQRDALRPFSPVHTLLVPLPCPQGGPPQMSSMLEVLKGVAMPLPDSVDRPCVAMRLGGAEWVLNGC